MGNFSFVPEPIYLKGLGVNMMKIIMKYYVILYNFHKGQMSDNEFPQTEGS